MADAECVLGFPGQDLERIVAELEELAAKALPRARGKAIYHSLVGRTT